MTITVKAEIHETISVLQALMEDRAQVVCISALVEKIVTAFKSHNKVLLAGNGGSAADAQHMAGEFVSRFKYDRPGLPAFALTVDTSVITAIGNDYGYETLFARQLRASGQKGDVFWAYSTSGRSANILRALEVAREMEIFTVGFTGNGPDTDHMRSLADLCIAVPSTSTPKIQEGHLVCGHIVCGMVEERMFPCV